MDLLLGTTPPASPAAFATAAARSRSVPARLDRLAGAGLRTSRSRAVLAPAAAPVATAADQDVAGPASEPGSPTGSASGGLCMICMDRAVRVQVRVRSAGEGLFSCSPGWGASMDFTNRGPVCNVATRLSVLLCPEPIACHSHPCPAGGGVQARALLWLCAPAVRPAGPQRAAVPL